MRTRSPAVRDPLSGPGAVYADRGRRPRGSGIRLAARPEGLPERAHFAVVEVPLREPGPGPGLVLVRNRHVARLRIIRDLPAHGFTVEDLRGVATGSTCSRRIPPPRCGSGGIVAHRPGVLDAEIGRLTRLRAALAQRAGASPAGSAPVPGGRPGR
ncbi:hypothetical protein OTB20_27745 [Streptomyces sp. H27-H1]|uniref:hypothetical protein n=1 Tax=Streptomyces sp. H27-H1 TaxID=2996461 RepID=UPI00226DD79E|nr:hypothetical protein [Streptomyces sp. H27-H1]MCY0929917.1 hypothetical protein [Streptomyces sp. H27-H1]